MGPRRRPRHVIALELLHSVDGVLTRNLTGLPSDRYDVVPCSIDRPPFRDRSIDGILICHNVVQHTPSVERTIRELWDMIVERDHAREPTVRSEGSRRI